VIHRFRRPSAIGMLVRSVLLACTLGAGLPFAQDATTHDLEAVIGPEDTITVIALNVEEISKAWRVGPSGDVSFPLVGRLHVAGKTVDEVEREIGERLKQFVKAPEVTVYISEFRSQPVTVSGAVVKPGVILLQGPTMLYSAIVQAGGVKDAGTTVTLTRNLRYGQIPHPDARPSPDSKYSVVELPLADAVRQDKVAGNILLKPSDAIVVSQERLPRLVYITGEVMRPGAVELVSRNEVSITQLLAMAGGLSRIAKPSKSVIRHIGETGTETSFQMIDLKKVIDGKAKDLVLGEGDIVVIPSSEISSYLRNLSSSVITSSVFLLGRL